MHTNHPTPDAIRGNVLALAPAQESALTSEERINLSQFERHAKKYLHRIAWPLTEDPFLDGGLKDFLEAREIRFARVPFQSINTVFYLFKDMDAVRAMVAFTAPAQTKHLHS